MNFLLLQLRLFLVDFFLHAGDLILLIHQFLDTRLIVKLLVVEVSALLVKERLENIHQVQETCWGDVVVTSRFDEESTAQFTSFYVENLARLHDLKLQFMFEGCNFHHLHSDSVECLDRPFVEPVKCTTVDEGWEVADALAKGVSCRAHSKDDMQVLLNFLDEKVEDFFTCTMIIELDVSFLLCDDSHLFAHQDLVICSEQAWDFVLVDQVVDIFQHETVLKLVVSQQESALFEITTCLVKQLLHVFGPLLVAVTLALFWLITVLVHEETGKVAETLSARATNSNKESVTLVHLEDTADSQKVSHCVVKENKVHSSLSRIVVRVKRIAQRPCQFICLLIGDFVVAPVRS